MFALHDMLKVYAERPALGPLTLTLPPGRTTVLSGPSGCGKSTFLRLLIGLVDPDAGEVTFDGKPVAPATVRAVRLRVGYVNIGTATLGGFIGAGGYGGPILRGIDKFDGPLMLEGAVPAALLALVIEGSFELVQRFVPHHG